MLLLLVLAILALERHARGRARFFTPTASQRPAPRAQLKGMRAAAASAACLLPVLLGFVIPVVLLLRLLGRRATLSIGLDTSLGFQTRSASRWQALRWSSSSCLGLAYAARAAERGVPQLLVQSAVRLMSLGYALPGAVVAVGILVPLARFDNGLDAIVRATTGWHTGLLLTGSVFALLYGYLVRYFAVAFQSVEAGLARITPAMDASARSLGSSPWETFVRVHLPVLAPSVLAATLLVLVDVMKELPATLVLRPFNFDTLAVVAFQLASDERLGEAALPALTIVAVGMLPVALLSRAIARATGPGHA